MRHAASFALTLALAASGWTQTWDETADGGGNADDLPGTAQTTFGEGTLMEITGSFASNADVDMFRIYVADFAFFSADTSISPGTATDTELYLFTDAGIGIAFNDDQAATTRARLPVGNALYATREPGNYLLAVCRFDRDPENSSGQIFQNTPFTSIIGPNGAGSALPVTTWTGAGGASGTYRITLTGTEFAPRTSLEGGAEGSGEGGSQGGSLSVTRRENPGGGGGGGCYAPTDTRTIHAALALLLAVAVAGLLRR